MPIIPSNIERLRERVAILRAASQQLWHMARDIDEEIIEQRGAGIISMSLVADKPALSRKELLAKAEAIYKSRRRREKLLGKKLFADPAWDMLLDLYVHGLKDRRVSTTSLCVASMVPNTTALRWIKLLEDAGFIQKNVPSGDRRVQQLALSERGYQAMTAFFTEQTPEESLSQADGSIFFRTTP